MMEFFVKTVNEFQLFSQKDNIDVCVGSKHASEKNRNFRDEAKVHCAAFLVYF